MTENKEPEADEARAGGQAAPGGTPETSEPAPVVTAPGASRNPNAPRPPDVSAAHGQSNGVPAPLMTPAQQRWDATRPLGARPFEAPEASPPGPISDDDPAPAPPWPQSEAHAPAGSSGATHRFAFQATALPPEPAPPAQPSAWETPPPADPTATYPMPPQPAAWQSPAQQPAPPQPAPWIPTPQPAGPAMAVAEPSSAQPGQDNTRQNHPGTNQSEFTWNLDPVIEMVNVVKAFGSFKVLDGVSFRIPRGGVTFLMGPSGTGKSVALRHIVGLLMPDKGDVLVEGQNVPKLKEKEVLELRRTIGMLFQDGALFSSMNLYDNVAFPLRQHTKMSEGEIRETVMQRLSEVGLAGAEKRQPNELSGGMRKRAGFARALVMRPKIILVDEPDSGLDPVRTTLLCDLIKEIAKKYEATVIVISHNIEAVRRTADYIGILYKGKMRHFGTKEEIEKSQDEFVHQFFNAEPEGPLGMD
jgi:phospholipid/cholesterol/gamma-HCH transport system ATP-binding protein